jgi:hypothetical protein
MYPHGPLYSMKDGVVTSLLTLWRTLIEKQATSYGLNIGRSHEDVGILADMMDDAGDPCVDSALMWALHLDGDQVALGIREADPNYNTQPAAILTWPVKDYPAQDVFRMLWDMLQVMPGSSPGMRAADLGAGHPHRVIRTSISVMRSIHTEDCTYLDSSANWDLTAKDGFITLKVYPFHMSVIIPNINHNDFSDPALFMVFRDHAEVFVRESFGGKYPVSAYMMLCDLKDHVKQMADRMGVSWREIRAAITSTNTFRINPPPLDTLNDIFRRVR